jgi:hypothetical protein|tara:strand:- start:127 stop:354 length:228 start_codon:yes stop_codon:yes gene_type:complete
MKKPKSRIVKVTDTPLIYETKTYVVDGMRVLAREPMEVGPHVNAKTFDPQPKGGSSKRARGGGAATKGLKFEGVR